MPQLLWVRVSLLTIVLAACTAAPTSPVPGVEPTATVAVRPTQAAVVPATPTPAALTPTPAPSDLTTTRPAPSATARPARPADDDFRPSDPNGVLLAAGRPQLVEFYAVW